MGSVDWFPILLLAGLAIFFVLRYGRRRRTALARRPRQTATAPRQATTGVFHWPGTGDYDFDAVGESHYQRTLARVAGAHGKGGANAECTATLIPEDDNPHDAKAVAVLVDGRPVAYLSREDARRYRRRLTGKKMSGAVTTCDALVVGGGTRNGKPLSYGIRLDMVPFD